VKKIEVVASVKTKEQKPPVKTKKMTKPENKPMPKMVRVDGVFWYTKHVHYTLVWI
jgi:cytochrome oxidase assembly protein ShyY1